jgi:hypothetical protein
MGIAVPPSPSQMWFATTEKRLAYERVVVFFPLVKCITTEGENGATLLLFQNNVMNIYYYIVVHLYKGTRNTY